MKIYSRLLFIFCYAVIYATVATVTAQVPVFRNYTSADGLPSSETYCAMQDSKGYLWFGTDRGIVRFNGHSFQSFPFTLGLTDNTVFNLYEDSLQRVWCNTYSGWSGYLYKDSAYPYTRSRSITNASPRWHVFPTAKGMWLNEQEGKRLVLTFISSTGVRDTSLNGDTGVKTLYLPGACSNGNVWLVSGSLLNNRVRVLQLPGKEVLAEIGSHAQTFLRTWQPIVCRQRNGTLWLAVNGEVTAWNNGRCLLRLLRKDRVLSIHEDNRHNIWIGYLNRGLELFKAAHGYTRSWRFLAEHSVSGMLCDREGGMWFTTLEKGIYYLPPFFGFSYTAQNGLPVSKTERILNVEGNAMMMLSDKSVYLARSGDKPVAYMRRRHGATLNDIQHASPGPVYYSGHPGLSAPAVSTYGSRPFKPRQVLVNAKKMHIGSRYIWGVLGNSLRKYAKGNGNSLREWCFEDIGTLTCVFEKRNKELLIGTLKGLYIFRNGRLTKPDYGNEALNCRVSDIRRLDSATLVIATVGCGIVVMNEQDGHNLITYTAKDGLPGVMCHVVFPENDTVLWVGTNLGVCRLTHAQERRKASFFIVDRYDGIVSNEVHDISVTDNEVWLGTAEGVSVIPKANLLRPVTSIPLHIEQVAVNGQALHGALPVNFSHSQNNISISFAALSYQYAGKLLYEYRMAGAGNTWNTTQNRSVTFDALPPGSYVFELKAAAPNRTGSAGVARYAFTIMPAWWQTWWFRALAILGLMGATASFVRLRIRSVRNHAKLTGQLALFRDKALRGQMNPHFIYNSLNSIQSYILKNDIGSSAAFLAKFSRLMRLTFNNTSMNSVSLERDLEALKLYAELENLGFREKFTFVINESLQQRSPLIQVPPLIFQPFVENAILHGLLAREGAGLIQVDIREADDCLEVTISDNGIGREKAARLKEKRLQYHAIAPGKKHSGMRATVARIEQCWGRRPENARFAVKDLYEKGTATGTTVYFCLPLVYDESNYYR